MSLARAVAAMKQRDVSTARDQLILVWRRRRSPLLGELIALLDARAPDEVSAQIAAIVTPRAASSLDNLRELDGVDDPRLAAFAIEALARPPFTSAGADAFLLALVETAVRHKDPRLAARGDEIRAALTTRIGRLAIRTQLLGVLDRARPKPLMKPSASDARLEDELAQLVEPLRATGRSADALLAAIHADPTDDAARLVYADLLTEHGHPRGEFIALQLANTNPERQAELLALHGKTWLGDLAPVLSWGRNYAKTTFRRGFVSNADIILSVGKKLGPILAHPAWATVETFTGLYRDAAALLAHAPLHALRELDMLDLNKVEHLRSRRDKLASVTRVELGFPLPSAEALREALPNATTLVRAWREPDLAALAQWTAFGIPHVEMFGAHGQVERFAARLVGTPAEVERLTLHDGWVHDKRPPPIVLVRGHDGAYRMSG